MTLKRFIEYSSEYGILSALFRSIFKIHYTYYNYNISKKINAKGLKIHPSASLICLECIDIGSNFFAGKHLHIEAVKEHKGYAYNPKISIGNNVTVADFVHIAATRHVKIGNNVLMGSKIYISDHNHGIYSGKEQSDPNVPPVDRYVSSWAEVNIEDNVWIGEMVSILPGVTIGHGSIVGANSVITKDISPYSIAAGVPAKVIKKYDFEKKIWKKT